MEENGLPVGTAAFQIEGLTARQEQKYDFKKP